MKDSSIYKKGSLCIISIPVPAGGCFAALINLGFRIFVVLLRSVQSLIPIFIVLLAEPQSVQHDSVSAVEWLVQSVWTILGYFRWFSFIV